MHKVAEKILVSYAEIEKRTKELGAELSKDYKDKEPIFVAILKGSIPFFALLMNYLDIDGMYTDFMDVKSYEGVNSTHDVKIRKDIETNVADKDVVIVEDIVDTGYTLEKLISILKSKGARSVKVVTLLNKQERRIVDVKADYVAFEIPNEFVIGFGLDYYDQLRQLPYVAVLKKEYYEKQ